jgi:hypothetical protein
MVWIGRLCAATAVVLFALVLLAVHRERQVHQSTDEIVATFRVNNGYFDHRVDFSHTERIRDRAGDLRRTLDDIQAAATDDVRLLGAIRPDATRLLTAAGSDLRTAHELTGIAEDLRDTAGDILGTADHAGNTVTWADARVASILDLIAQLNRRLADIDRKLPLPAGGPGLLLPRTEPSPR